MSVFSWFSGKKSSASGAASGMAGKTPSERTQPMGLGPASPSPANPSAASTRKAENSGLREQLKTQSMQRREHLYAVVRESMLRVGRVAANYKFKVLALDQSARLYLVMIDLASVLGHDAKQMAQVEALIEEEAKSRYDIVVTGVYWRMDERLSGASAASPVAPESAKKPLEPAVPEQDHGTPGYEPMQTEEMLAFKRALAVTSAPPPAPGAARAPAHGYSPLATGYEDTQVVSPETRPPGLGDTQHGALD